MRSILIGAVEGTGIALKEMQRAGFAPALLATLPPDVGPSRHADYIALTSACTDATEIYHVDHVSDPAFLERVAALGPDFIFVIGWSQIVGPELRALARGQVVGFHPTA